MVVLKLRKYGNSTGTTFPKELLHRLRVKEGDELFVIETPRGFELTPYDPEIAEQMDVAEKIMRERRDVLRKLAE
jgi:putative addiction module antidote